jgi:hypothetical protein
MILGPFFAQVVINHVEHIAQGKILQAAFQLPPFGISRYSHQPVPLSCRRSRHSFILRALVRSRAVSCTLDIPSRLHPSPLVVALTSLIPTQLLTVSVLTLFLLIITGIYHHLRALSPKVNLALNGLNTIFWALGFALLIWNTRSTLSNRCAQATWHSEDGVMVCRLYKALATFNITGL